MVREPPMGTVSQISPGNVITTLESAVFSGRMGAWVFKYMFDNTSPIWSGLKTCFTIFPKYSVFCCPNCVLLWKIAFCAVRSCDGKKVDVLPLINFSCGPMASRLDTAATSALPRISIIGQHVSSAISNSIEFKNSGHFSTYPVL